MDDTVIIDNLRGHIEWTDCDECIFVFNLFVNEEYRGRHYPKLMFDILKKHYGKPIQLMCRPELFSYYRKLGFRLTYHEMEY